MAICSAYGCKSRSERKEPGISFHRFPLKKPKLVSKWVKNMNVTNWIPKKNDRLCSKHFDTTMFYIIGKKTLLLDDAVPEIFSNTNHKRVPETNSFQEEPELGLADVCTYELRENDDEQDLEIIKLEVEEPEEELEEPEQELEEPITMITPTNSRMTRHRRYPVKFRDFERSDLNDPEKLDRFWKLANEEVKKYKNLKRVNLQKIRRHETRIKTLNVLLAEFKKHHKKCFSQFDVE